MASIKSTASQNWLSTVRQNKRNSRLRGTLLATAPVALALVSAAHGQSLTFDASGSATSASTVTDGSGFWDVTNSLGNPDTNWFGSLFDSTWINGDAAVFGNAANNPSSGAAGNVMIDDDSGSVTASEITFNAAQSGNYTISAIAGDSLVLNGAGTINVATGLSPTISAPIAGTVGLTFTGPGTLNLAGNNTYSGTTNINSGLVIIDAGSNLGAATNTLNLGQVSTTASTPFPVTTTGSLTVNSGITVAALNVMTNSATANQLAIAAGQTLTVSGSFTAGLTPPLVVTVTGSSTSSLTATGGGSLVVATSSSGSFIVEQGAANTTSPQNPSAIVDLSGLNTFVFGSASNGGELVVGVANHANGNLKLAQNSTIIANDVRVGDSHSAFNGSNINGGGTSTLSVGSGNATIDANTIDIGSSKSSGVLNFETTTGALTINNEAGTGGAALNVGVGGSGSGGSVGTVNLTGHSVTLNLTQLNIGNRTSSVTSATATVAGSLAFDNGTVNATGITLAHASGNTSVTGSNVTGTLTVGSAGDTNTATLNVNIGNAAVSQNIANTSGAALGNTATGILNIDSGGIANINGNLVVGTPITGSTENATVNVAGGLLNMMGSSIGGTTTVTLNTTGGELENVGAINTTGGVTMNTAGNTLILDGTNGYSGGTTISAGTVQVGHASDTAPLTSPLGAAASAVSNATTLNFASSQATAIANPISGVGVVNQNGAGITTLTGASTYTGVTSVNAGGLALGSGGSLGNTAVTVAGSASFQASAGTSIGTTDAGTSGGSLTINNGGTLSVVDSGTPGNFNINQQSGASGAVGLALMGTTNLNFQLDAAAVDGIAVNGLLTVNDASSTNLVNILTAGDASLTPGAYALITDANGDISGGGTASFKFASDSSSTETLTVGSQQYQLTLSTSSTSETLNVATIGGGPASLTWNNASTNNLWDTAISSNWNNGATNTVFHASDNVTFNDNNGGAGNYAVTLNTVVSPGSVVVNNSAGNYTISGTGTIGGTASLTKSGSGSLTLSTPNTYSGGTIVNQGLLEILRTSATTSALPKGAVTITGGMLQLATNVTAGSQSSPTPASNVNITSLAISGSGQLDINNNHIIINYGGGPDPIASIAALIKSGFNSGAWNGIGIMSTSAQSNGASYGIGYADSADPGNPAGLASGQIEIEYTLLGDANLDGAVNGSDFAILATNFNKAVSGWDAGDFNYDGAANGADFASLATNFNKGASQAADATALDSFAAANGLLASVPEPASAGLLALGAMGMLGQRRRKAQR